VSVVARRTGKHDPLELGERRATKPQSGLEALEAHLARVEGAPEFVEGLALVIGDLIARRVEENQVARALEAVGKADVALALGGVKAFDRNDHGLAGLEALGDSGGEQLVCPGLDLVLVDLAGEELADPDEGEGGTAFLDHAVSEPGRL
jgi:hypothetical protein